MTDGKHTPGPWKWVEDKGEWGGTWLFSGDVPVLDYAGCGSHDTDISDADAHLISAAPDLLEALKACECFCDENGMVNGVNVRAVIAKAEGRTSD